VSQAWADARLAAALLAVDPVGLGGATLRAGPGPARDAWLALWARLAPDRLVMRLPPGIDDARLLGGLDLAATLAAGRPVLTAGLIAEAAGRTLVLPMAERAASGLAGRLNAARDAGADFTLILLDEGAGPGEAAPEALADRLAFRPALEGLALADLTDGGPDPETVAAARRALPDVTSPPDLVPSLVEVAQALGVTSLRAPMLALRAARAAAALAGEGAVDAAAAEAAARLVLAPRATQLPAPPEAPPPEPEPESAPQEAPDPGDGKTEVPQEVLLEAARAAIPPDLLARLMTGALRRGPDAGGGAGDDRASKARGRPAGAMRGLPRGGARIDLVETLRAAAPWQPLRRAAPGGGRAGVLVRPDDFRIRRSKRRAEKVVVFVVDASGSTALARLAEAKGAIELLLGQAYVARQQVALIAFRGTGAEVLLPPTRSLVMTKRRLARLPGGGGTPLASGLQAALDLAERAAARGMVPHLAILTDGRANVGLDGTPGRPGATDDAERMARAVRAAGRRAVLIDTGNRPAAPARALAETMAADYLPLPRADAAALSHALGAALDRPG